MRNCEVDNCSYPVFGTDKLTGIGYCRGHQHKRTDTDKRSAAQKHLSKQQNQRERTQLRSLIANPNKVVLLKGSSELQRWFEDRRKEMTGICQHCGGKTERDNDQYYKYSIAHLFQKAYFKSIATNENNWLELCYFNNSCHSQYDNHMIDIIDLNCFDSVITKFVKMYPFISPDEHRRIPTALLKYIEVEK